MISNMVELNSLLSQIQIFLKSQIFTWIHVYTFSFHLLLAFLNGQKFKIVGLCCNYLWSATLSELG